MWQCPARFALWGRFQRLTRQGTEEEPSRPGWVSLRQRRTKERQKTRRPRGSSRRVKCLARRRLEDRDRQGSIQTAHDFAIRTAAHSHGLSLATGSRAPRAFEAATKGPYMPRETCAGDL